MTFIKKSRWSKVVLLFLCLSVVEKGWVRQTHPFELGAVVITTQEMLSALTLAGSMIWRACTNSNNSAVDRVLQSEISKLTKRHDMPSAHPTVSAQQAKPVPVTKPATSVRQVSSPSVQKTSNVTKARAIATQISHEHVVQAVYTALPEATKVASQELLATVSIDWQKQIERSCCESIRSARAHAYNQMQMHIQDWNQKWTCENNDKGGITYRAPNPQAYASINSKNRRIVGPPAETPEHFERMVIDLNAEFSMPVQTVIQAFVNNAQSLVYGTLPERVTALLTIGELAIDGITYGQELCDAKSALYAAYCHKDGSVCMQALNDMSAAQKIMHEYYGFKRAHTALFRKPCITSSHKPCKQLIKKKRKVSFEAIRNQQANHCCQRILHAFAAGEIQQAEQIKNSHAHLHNLAVLYNALKVEYDRAIAEQEASLKDAYGIVHFKLPVELQDPVYTTLSDQDRARLQHTPSALASFNDMLKLRQLYKQALHKAWNIPASADPVVHEALYVLIDCGAIPERIDKICELVSNTKNIHEQQELMQALFLPNGIIKDFAEYDRAKSLTMPAAILKEEHAQTRLLLNRLVYAEHLSDDQYVQCECAQEMEYLQDKIRGICGTAKIVDISLPAGTCLPKQHTNQEPSEYIEQQDPVEKERCGTGINEPEFKPIPCGYQGQTLPGLGSDDIPVDEIPGTQEENGEVEDGEDRRLDIAHEPDEETSAQNCQDSPNIIYDAETFDTEIVNELADLSDVLVKVEGRGSTGRTEPNNLLEKLAMNEVMAHPNGIHLEKVIMTDRRWPATEGWVKKAQCIDLGNNTKVDIHYVHNEILNSYDDFKFKD